jgi:hypothetical protein
LTGDVVPVLCELGLPDCRKGLAQAVVQTDVLRLHHAEQALHLLIDLRLPLVAQLEGVVDLNGSHRNEGNDDQRHQAVKIAHFTLISQDGTSTIIDRSVYENCSTLLR